MSSTNNRLSEVDHRERLPSTRAMSAAIDAIRAAHNARLEQLERDAKSGVIGIGSAIGLADIAGREYERLMAEQVKKELAELRAKAGRVPCKPF